jgi:hypothetical protein
MSIATQDYTPKLRVAIGQPGAALALDAFARQSG